MKKGIGKRKVALRVFLALLLTSGCGSPLPTGPDVRSFEPPNIPIPLPPSSSPEAPRISNLVSSYLDACTFEGNSGRTLQLRFDYADQDGDVRGGRLETTDRLNPGGGLHHATYELPGEFVEVSGTTSGQITLRICALFFGNAQSVTVWVTLFDAANHRSNQLSTTVPRPG